MDWPDVIEMNDPVNPPKMRGPNKIQTCLAEQLLIKPRLTDHGTQIFLHNVIAQPGVCDGNHFSLAAHVPFKLMVITFHRT